VDVENLGEVFGFSSELLLTALEELGGPKKHEIIPKTMLRGSTLRMKSGLSGTHLVLPDLVLLLLLLGCLAPCRLTSGPEKGPYERS
jgi:hypothetical protein